MLNIKTKNELQDCFNINKNRETLPYNMLFNNVLLERGVLEVGSDYTKCTYSTVVDEDEGEEPEYIFSITRYKNGEFNINTHYSEYFFNS